MDKSVGAELAKTNIKKENFDEEIKEFAESAMNELLGWYGYDAPKDNMRTTDTCRSNSNSNSSGPESPRYNDGCGWCNKPVEENTGLTSGASTFCSELCFSQSRRANFKKNKTCDWCRHVRHTVSYVDFQEGASQLQFCSDKCLNQYKMHIFCRETRAHLEMHPHLPIDDSGGGLITPDLWMKNCKSPDSRTPSPPASPRQSEMIPQTSPLPLITVAHPSKLMASPAGSVDSHKKQRNKTQRKPRKRCASTVTCATLNKSPSDVPQDLRVRHSPVNGFEHPQFRDDLSKNSYQQNHGMDRIPNPFCYPTNAFPPDPRMQQPQFFNSSQFLPPVRQHTTPTTPNAGVLPPVTVLVPYPVLVPVPLPIPIPLPLKSFVLANEKRKESNKNDNDASLNKTPSEVNDVASKSSHREEEEEEEEDIDVTVDVDEPKLAHKNGIVKPPRKRKRVVEPKSKVSTKKKTIPA